MSFPIQANCKMLSQTPWLYAHPQTKIETDARGICLNDERYDATYVHLDFNITHSVWVSDKADKPDNLQVLIYEP